VQITSEDWHRRDDNGLRIYFATSLAQTLHVLTVI
jgi:hypothetical protein